MLFGGNGMSVAEAMSAAVNFTDLVWAEVAAGVVEKVVRTAARSAVVRMFFILFVAPGGVG
jgi:hypothetical protein